MKRFVLLLVLISSFCFVSAHSWPAYTATQALQLPLADHVIKWPPQLGKPYPDLVLYNHKGEITHLSDFKGKILLIEPVGMNCEASNALAGGRSKGGYNGTIPESDVNAAEVNFKYWAPGISFDDPRIVHIQLLLYNFSMQGPGVADAKSWAEHFGYDRRPNVYVLAGGPELINQASYDMIPGFQLVDQNFILRSNATGHHPSEGWNKLMGRIPGMIGQ